MKMIDKAIKYCKDMNYAVRKLPNKQLYKVVDLCDDYTEIVGKDVLITYYNDGNGAM